MAKKCVSIAENCVTTKHVTKTKDNKISNWDFFSAKTVSEVDGSVDDDGTSDDVDDENTSLED